MAPDKSRLRRLRDRFGANAINISILLVAVLTLVVAVLLPIRLEERQREVQNQGNCSNALLSLRRELSTYYASAEDSQGNINEYDSKGGRHQGPRIAAQSARDAVYALCIYVCDNAA